MKFDFSGKTIVLSLLLLLVFGVVSSGIYYVALIRNDAVIARKKADDEKAENERKEPDAEKIERERKNTEAEVGADVKKVESQIKTNVDNTDEMDMQAARAAIAQGKQKKKPQNTEEIVELVEKSVALIKGKYSSGSGFIIRPNVVATNRHVVDDEFMELSTVHFPSVSTLDKGPYKPKLLYVDPELDIAFLGVETKLPPIPVAENYLFKRGKEVIAIGSPGSGNADSELWENAVNKGLLSSQTIVRGHSIYQSR